MYKVYVQDIVEHNYFILTKSTVLAVEVLSLVSKMVVMLSA